MNMTTRVYKPEISRCPVCNSKLFYRYTVSNKVIQFSSGHKARVKNLGYSCTNKECRCKDVIFTSQTASKFCLKGYTYSAKIITLITVLKKKGISREKICAKLALMGIDISDRNIDNIASKELSLLEQDYKENIKNECKFMVDNYGQIRLSIDSLVVEGIRCVSVRDSFHNHQIGLHLFDKSDNEGVLKLLHDYVDDLNVKSITTVRKNTGFFKLLNQAVNRDMEYICFIKY